MFILLELNYSFGFKILFGDQSVIKMNHEPMYGSKGHFNIH